MKFYTITLLVLASIVAVSCEAFTEGAVRKCKHLLRLSPGDWRLFAQSHYNDTPGTRCMVRCIAILRGLYDDETAIDIDSLFTTSKEFDSTVEEFKTAYKACTAAIKPEEFGDDYCTKSTKFMDCFYDNVKIFAKEV